MNIKNDLKLSDWPLTSSMFMTNSTLLWWTLDSVAYCDQSLVKPKVVNEAMQWRSKRKCKVTSIKPN